MRAALHAAPHLQGQLSARVEAGQQRRALAACAGRCRRKIAPFHLRHRVHPRGSQQLLLVHGTSYHGPPQHAWESEPTPSTATQIHEHAGDMQTRMRHARADGGQDSPLGQRTGGRECLTARGRERLTSDTISSPTSSTLIRNRPPTVPSTATMMANTSGDDCLRPEHSFIDITA